MLLKKFKMSGSAMDNKAINDYFAGQIKIIAIPVRFKTVDNSILLLLKYNPYFVNGNVNQRNSIIIKMCKILALNKYKYISLYAEGILNKINTEPFKNRELNRIIRHGHFNFIEWSKTIFAVNGSIFRYISSANYHSVNDIYEEIYNNIPKIDINENENELGIPINLFFNNMNLSIYKGGSATDDYNIFEVLNYPMTERELNVIFQKYNEPNHFNVDFNNRQDKCFTADVHGKFVDLVFYFIQTNRLTKIDQNADFIIFKINDDCPMMGFLGDIYNYKLEIGEASEYLTYNVLCMAQLFKLLFRPDVDIYIRGNHDRSVLIQNIKSISNDFMSREVIIDNEFKTFIKRFVDDCRNYVTTFSLPSLLNIVKIYSTTLGLQIKDKCRDVILQLCQDFINNTNDISNYNCYITFKYIHTIIDFTYCNPHNEHNFIYDYKTYPKLQTSYNYIIGHENIIDTFTSNMNYIGRLINSIKSDDEDSFNNHVYMCAVATIISFVSLEDNMVHIFHKILHENQLPKNDGIIKVVANALVKYFMNNGLNGDKIFNVHGHIGTAFSGNNPLRINEMNIITKYYDINKIKKFNYKYSLINNGGIINSKILELNEYPNIVRRYINDDDNKFLSLSIDSSYNYFPGEDIITTDKMFKFIGELLICVVDTLNRIKSCNVMYRYRDLN
jgi:hypothetical protein